jgi:flagellar biosynthesis anti-sigma factor FlgM
MEDIMKVTNHKNPNAEATQTSGAHSSKRSGAADKSGRSSAASLLADMGSPSSSSSSRVEVSPRAREISRANEIARSGPEIDDARVAHFQNLIDKGMYKPDASKIADKMVDEQVMNLFASGGDEE